MSDISPDAIGQRMLSSWTRYKLSPPMVFGAITAAGALAIYLPTTSIMMASGVHWSFGHHQTLPYAFLSCAIAIAVMLGLLHEQRWARAIQWMQPLWLGALEIVSQGELPNQKALVFDGWTGALWLLIYWWWLYKNEESQRWFAGY
jgi:hypothetical protein